MCLTDGCRHFKVIRLCCDLFALISLGFRCGYWAERIRPESEIQPPKEMVEVLHIIWQTFAGFFFQPNAIKCWLLCCRTQITSIWLERVRRSSCIHRYNKNDIELIWMMWMCPCQVWWQSWISADFGWPCWSLKCRFFEDLLHELRDAYRDTTFQLQAAKRSKESMFDAFSLPSTRPDLQACTRCTGRKGKMSGFWLNTEKNELPQYPRSPDSCVGRWCRCVHVRN